MSKPVPHLPWEPSEGVTIDVPMGRFMPPVPGWFAFRRVAWPYGSYNVDVMCERCQTQHTAGAAAGERRIVRWAINHRCKPQTSIFGEEDARLFR